MNEHEHKINIARIEYPLKNTILLNPIIGLLKNNSGEETLESKVLNRKIVDVFLVRIKNAHEKEISDSDNKIIYNFKNI